MSLVVSLCGCALFEILLWVVNEIRALSAQGRLGSHGAEGAQHEGQMERSGSDISISVTKAGDGELGESADLSILRRSYPPVTCQSAALRELPGS